MGNCKSYNAYSKQNNSAFDRVTSRTSKADDCLIYQLADYQKGGDLIKFFNREGVRATEELLKEQMPLLLYNKGDCQIVTRTDYLKWKYRSKGHVGIPMDEKVPDWKDHKACWNFEYRGSLGESLLHVLIVCNSSVHSKIARMLILAFPNLALDVVEGNEFRGASALHLAIAYNNLELIKLLVEAGAAIDQRAVGTFFLPRDQQRARPKKTTDYEGLAYFGELPLAWAACCNNESAYNLLVDRGADPNAQDAFGNMVLHMVVVCDKLEMYGYALRHPRLPAKMGIVNKAGLTPLTLSCHLGRATIFREMLELTAKEFWRYSNITCSAYPLNALDTILPDGRCNMNSALMIILNGTKEEHLNMLDGGIIQRLLEEKWKTFAQVQFLKRLGILFFHLFVLSGAVYTRPAQQRPLIPHPDDMIAMDYTRFCFEIITCLSCVGYVIIQQSSELRNLGLKGFLSQLSHNPAKAIFLVSNLLTLSCIPCRFANDRDTEEAILIFAVPSAWFFLMFFAGAIRLTGPFVTMIYSMITGDMLTFAIIYSIMLMAFSQAFYFLHRGNPDSPPLFNNYFSTFMGLFQWTMGDYQYSTLEENIYPSLTKIVFVIFMVMVPILLLNMLIAMMGNTYALVIQQSEKEWVKQWAKIVIALERAVSQHNAKEYLVTYSIKISGGSDGKDGSPPQDEVRGVMVIKSKNKTRARQRKGALGNWKRVGRVTINKLKRLGITGESLRKQIWEPRTPSTTSPNASTCVTPVPCPTSAAMLLMDLTNDMSSTVGPTGIPHKELPPPVIPKEPPVSANAFDFSSAFNDLSAVQNNKKISNATNITNDLFNTNLINQMTLNSAMIDDVFQATSTAPVAVGPPPPPPVKKQSTKEDVIKPTSTEAWPPLSKEDVVKPTSTEAWPPQPKEDVVKPTSTEAWPPLPPLSAVPPSFADHLMGSSTQLSDLENEIIAQTLLSNVVISPRPSEDVNQQSSPKKDKLETLPPLFRPRVLDESPVLERSSTELRRQSSPGVFQHFNSLPETLESKRNGSLVNHQPKIIIDLELNAKNLASTTSIPKDTTLLAAAPDPSIGKSVHKSRGKSRQRRTSKTNSVAPSFYEQQPLPHHSNVGHESCIFQQMGNKTPQLARSTTLAERGRDPKVFSGLRRHSDNESVASSSGADESLYTTTRVSITKPAVKASTTSSSHNTSSESNPVYTISGNVVTDHDQHHQKKVNKKPSKLRGSSKSKRINKNRAVNNVEPPALRPLSSTSERIIEAKVNHFNAPASPMNLDDGDGDDDSDSNFDHP